MEILVHIKRMVIAGQVLFTEKAQDEMDVDGLVPELVYEAIPQCARRYQDFTLSQPRLWQTRTFVRYQKADF